MMLKYCWLVLCCLVMLALSGCGASAGDPPDLPDLADYQTIDSGNLSGFIQSLGEEAAELTQQPGLAETAKQIDQVIACYQDTGAVQARIYSHKDNPLIAGSVAIADRNAVLNPRNFFNCIAPENNEATEEKDQAAFKAQGLNIEPCTANYTVSRDNNDYYILYAGTIAEVCQAFCEQLESCTAH